MTINNKYLQFGLEYYRLRFSYLLWLVLDFVHQVHLVRCIHPNIFVTFSALKPLKFKLVKDVQEVNIPLISVTLEVSQLLISKFFMLGLEKTSQTY